jgi:hypothetical protein
MWVELVTQAWPGVIGLSSVGDRSDRCRLGRVVMLSFSVVISCISSFDKILLLGPVVLQWLHEFGKFGVGGIGAVFGIISQILSREFLSASIHSSLSGRQSGPSICRDAKKLVDECTLIKSWWGPLFYIVEYKEHEVGSYEHASIL